MPLSEDIVTNRYRFTGYTQTSVSVNEIEYSTNLILSPDDLIQPWNASSVGALQYQDFDAVLALNPEVVLLGTGEHQIFPEPAIFGLFGERRIGLEVMNNGALCRTFNILVAEDRAVVAALFLDKG